MKSPVRAFVIIIVNLAALSGCRDIAEANLPYGYIIEPDQVLWYDRPIEGADPATFEWLTDDGKKLPWGRDKHRAYYRNLPVPDSDPETFEGFKEIQCIAKDKNRVYIGEYYRNGEVVLFSGANAQWRREMRLPGRSVEVIEEADAKSFRYLKCHWFVDDYHLFRRERMIEHVDPNTFRPLDPERGKWRDWHVDANHVYKGDVLVEHADPNSFRIDPETGDPMDDRFVFHMWKRYEAVINGEVVPANSSGWKELTEFYRTDGELVFKYGGGVIEGADPDSFEVLSGAFCRDANDVFYRDKSLPNVDAASFRITADGIPVDRLGPLGERVPD